MNNFKIQNPSFYLAGGYHRKQQLEQNICDLENLGYKCTWDWTQTEEHSQDYDVMAHYAALDLDGVCCADFVVAVIDDKDYSYRGTFTEIGCALGQKKPVYLYCPHNPKEVYARSNVFYCHPGINHYDDWKTLLKHVQLLHKLKKLDLSELHSQ